MDIKVYTKKRCPHCFSAKTWLNKRNYTYQEISLDDPNIRDEFVTKYPDLKSVPQIFVGEENIGGFSDLIKSKLA